ncbi:MAG TPA: enoyl-CoA hydratase-related protein [Pyrinomonadaceae bacterium]
MSLILCERNKAVTIIRLNRPEKFNAFSAAMSDDLFALLDLLQQQQDLRVVILTGAGERAFSAGTDIAELDGLTEAEALELSARGQQLCERIESFPVPVIAAVNGVAAGGGCELALACHLRVASKLATFSLPETKLGIIPAYGGTQRLPRDIGVARALEAMLAGKVIDAQSAFNFGLINRLVEPHQLMSETVSLANEIASLAPLAVRACLKAVSEGLELPLEDGLRLERELFASLFTTEDAHEGTRAFLEKRAPEFKGR